MIANNNKLISFHIVERENNRNLITWTYPTLTDDLRQYLLARCFSLSKSSNFFCFRRSTHWVYIQQVDYNNNESDIAIVLMSQDCDIPKYKTFSNVLTKKYLKCKNPVELVKLYLNVKLTGNCSVQDNGNLISCNLKSFEKQTNVKEIVNKFGLETIILYTALLLKRRILVYYDDLEKLQEEMLAMASLVSRRNLNEFFLPYIENMSDTKGYSFYLGGTLDDTAYKRDNIFDVFVNLHTNDITISEKTQDVFNMTKIQKTIANYFVESMDEKISENEFLNKLNQHTEDIIKNLKSLADKNSNIVTLSDLKSKQFNKHLENFLFNLGIAENIVML